MEHQIDEDVRQEILRRLSNAEAEHGVRVLFAIESGSRAWGFASPNSDYDVRFIYMHEPSWYQAVDLEERRDVIEYPIVDDIDLNGWDVRKALRLFWKSNPAFVEWIQSPITYIEHGTFRANVLEALPKVYMPEKGIYHYRHTAKSNNRHLVADMVRLKKYFYTLRPLLAARWLTRTGQVAPIEFERLLVMLDDAPVLQEIEKLLVLKRAAPELGLAPAVPVLNAFIDAELESGLGDIATTSADPEVVKTLNELFHSALSEWSDTTHS